MDFKYIGLVAISTLMACGGGGGGGMPDEPTPDPVQPNSLPTQPELASSEIGKGSFSAFFTQSDLADGVDGFNIKPFEIGNANIVSRTATFYIDPDDESVLHVLIPRADPNSDPTEFTYDLVGTPERSGTGSGERIYYRYEDSNTNEFVEIFRFVSGTNFGRFREIEFEVLEDRRANFFYGWPINRSELPVGGEFNYALSGGADLMLSDGRRLFGGDVDLTADFSNNKINGVLFSRDGTGPGRQRLTATVEVNGADINTDGSIDGSNNVTFTEFIDLSATTDPYANVEVQPPHYTGIGVSESTVSGQFVGANPDSVIGRYDGSAQVILSDGSTDQIDFGGTFRGNRQ